MFLFLFSHGRIIEIETNGPGTFNYIGLFLHGWLESERHHLFLHRRALQIQATGLGKLNYMGLFLHGCELGHEG